MTTFAVFDIETTGLSAAHHHRIIEVAVVLVDDAGSVVHEWETLLNPQRDVGATEIHGLTAADVYAAPTFDHIAAEVASLLSGRVPVAHNLSFDAPFLAAEFERLGYSVPLSPTSGLCTMRLASRYLGAGPRSLEACCGSIGCSMEFRHAALEDARAAARLLSYYINRDNDFLCSWGEVVSAAQRSKWPEIATGSSARISRQAAAIAKSQHFLGRLASKAPRTEIHPEGNSYLAVLDRVLLDRQVSRHEADELVSVAQMIGLSREEALVLHRLYLSGLVKLALEDGIVTPEERTDLDSVASALGLSAGDVDTSIEQVTQAGQVGYVVTGLTLRPGDAVVFTGEAPGIERGDLEYQARSLGLRPTSAVSGKTALLVAADPDSISGKARKARDLGVPIVDYPTYFNTLGSMAHT